jgi:TonB-linked SusC/RagA family outer membrane protein
MKIKNLFLLLGLYLFSLPLYSQETSISGVVKDDNGPLMGVSIIAKGTKTGTVTDLNGKFAIKISKQTKELVFSYLGYNTQTVVFGEEKILTITMKENTAALEEVVVIGYGTSIKSQLGGASLSTVNVDEMKKASVTSFEDALAGRIAGVTVTSSEGGPFSTNNIIIRGNSSLTQDNSPLWVVDGFPIENPQNNTINPSDIKSITVLKDAASIAIYGSRGSNGVIVVTTNQGQRGAPVVTFEGYYGIQQTLKRMKTMNPYEFLEYLFEISPDIAIPYISGDPKVIGRWGYDPNGRTLDYYKTAPYINWQDLMFRNAPMQSYTLSLSGGTDKNKYMISASYTDQQGTMIASSFKRYQGRVVFTQDINKNATFNLNLNLSNTRVEGTSPSNYSGLTSLSLLSAIWGNRPVVSPGHTLDEQLNSGLDPDNPGNGSYNPVMNALNSIANSTTNNIAANSYLEYKILRDLTLKISGGVNYSQRLSNNYYGLNTNRGSMATSITGPNGTISNFGNSNLLNENTLNYKKVFNKKHAVNILAGYSIQTANSDNSSLMASFVPNDALGVSGLDEGTPYSIGSGSTINALQSFFGRAIYNYNSKYFFTAVARADGSSKFAPGNKWAYFPSGSAAWSIDKENFMKPIKAISEFKLRASYGISGNNRVNDFAYLSPISLSNVATGYQFGNVFTPGAVQPTLSNKDLRWETTAATNIGVDLSILKKRISIIVDYYNKETTNLLLQANMPGHIGYTSGMINVGAVRNRGWEFSLNTVNLNTKAFTWNTNFNISFNKNKVLSLSSGQQGMLSPVSLNYSTDYPYLAQVGSPMSQIIGYKWVGNYQYSDFDKLPTGAYVLKGNVSANGNSRASILPGDIKYEDMNGDGIMTDADKVIIGNPNPLFTGGLSNNFTYAGFDLNVLFSFTYGNDIINANRSFFEGSQSTANQFETFVNRWTPDNQTNLYPRAGGTKINAVSTRFVEDGSFLRLKTVALGYRLPAKFVQKLKVKSARFYCSAQNLAVWSNYQGSDPEVSTLGGALTPGYDFAAYPRSFSMTLGFNLSF